MTKKKKKKNRLQIFCNKTVLNNKTIILLNPAPDLSQLGPRPRSSANYQAISQDNYKWTL